MVYRKTTPLSKARARHLKTRADKISKAETDLHESITEAIETEGASWEQVAEPAGFNSKQAVIYWYNARKKQ